MAAIEAEDGRRRRRSYDEAFKRDAVRLVAEEQYSFKAAAVNVSEQSLRAWHAKFAPAPTPCGEHATYQQTLKALGIECSMSRSGECYDNAVAERFFWSLKREWTQHESFADLEAARLSVFKYVETFDNPVRLHQSLGYKSPDQFEAEYAPALAA